jgi:HlyD family type I secretion membrane fusion protein
LILDPPESVQKLQAGLRAKAKRAPNCRFDLLYEMLYRKDVLTYAYRRCKANEGTPGIDAQDFAEVEAYGEERWLAELAHILRSKTYRTEAVRQVWMPNADGELRPVRIPRIADRVVMTAAMAILEPILTTDLAAEQDDYRPTFDAFRAEEEVDHPINARGGKAIEGSLTDGSTPHDGLLASVARRVSDRHMLDLIKMGLEAPVEEVDGRRKEDGTITGNARASLPQAAAVWPPLTAIGRLGSGRKNRVPETWFEAKIASSVDNLIRTGANAHQLLRPLMKEFVWRLGKLKRRDPDSEKSDWRRPAAFGYGVIIFTFVVLGGWSALAKLDSAVVAQGTVVNETSKRTVQHLEGGIIREILVREGQQVHQGQVLFRIDPVTAKASFDVQRNQLDFSMAQEARLLAERDGADEISFPEEIQSRRDEPNVAHAMSDQTKEFHERRASLNGQVDLLEAKIRQYQNEIGGLKLEHDATSHQLETIDNELTDLNYLLGKQLVQKSRVMALEREKSRLDGVIGRSTADQAKAESGIDEAKLQIRQIRQKVIEEVSGQILEVRQKIADLNEKLRVAADVLHRVDVVAPVSGSLQNLKVFTIGGVIKAGEPLVEVVPDHDSLVIQARVSPLDIERVFPGMQAEVRFSSFHTSLVPLILGRIDTVSRDRLTDEATRQPYFLAQVTAHDVPDYVRQHLTAGMPADVVIPTGERTVLGYLVKPLKDRLQGAMREE